MIDRAAAAATPPAAAEPTGDNAFWAERTYWRERFKDEIPGLQDYRLQEMLDAVAQRGSVAQRLEAFDVAEQHYRATSDSKGLMHLLTLVEATKSPEQQAAEAEVQSAAGLHLKQVDGVNRGVVPEPERLTEIFQTYAVAQGWIQPPVEPSAPTEEPAPRRAPTIARRGRIYGGGVQGV